MNQVIAFVGPAGSGKTTLIRSLVASKLDACPIFSDVYRSVATDGPRYKKLGICGDRAAERWFDEGCHPDDYVSIPQMVDDLRRLREGRPIQFPEPMWEGGEHKVEPARYILLEDCWFQRSELECLVDYHFQITLPFDVSLARYLKRDAGQGGDLSALLEQYLKFGSSYVRAVDALKANADLILCGTKPLTELTLEVTDWIEKNIEQD